MYFDIDRNSRCQWLWINKRRDGKFHIEHWHAITSGLHRRVENFGMEKNTFANNERVFVGPFWGKWHKETENHNIKIS